MKVYLDNCCYNRPFDDQNQMRIYLETQAKLYIQKLIRDGALCLAFSYVSRYENWNSPYAKNQITTERFFGNAITYIDIDKADTIEQKAIEIMKYGVKSIYQYLGGFFMNTTAIIMNDGINCLIERLGTIETEIFISQLIREPFDYTKWQREHYAGFSVSELNKRAVEYARKNPISEVEQSEFH